MDKNGIGDRIRQIRRSKKMTLKEVAERTGYSYQAIGQYERGDRNIGLKQMAHIAAALGVSIQELIGDNSALLEALNTNVLKTPEVLHANADVTYPGMGGSSFLTAVLKKNRELQGESPEEYDKQFTALLDDVEFGQKDLILATIGLLDQYGPGIGYVFLRFIIAYSRLNQGGREAALQAVEDMTQLERYKKEPSWKKVFPPEKPE